MGDVIPYSNLAEDPTTEVVIYWIDERDEADGSAQSIHYGDDESDLTESVTDNDPDEVPELDGTWVYVAVIDELDADTRYYAEIRDDSDDVLETCQWVTLPNSLDSRDITVAVSSDWHTDHSGSQYMNDPEDVDVIWGQDPDLHLFVGDYNTTVDSESQSNAEDWVRIFREYYDRYDDEELVHILAVPGNHEVGNHQWDGTDAESVDPDRGYFSFFYGHPRLLDGPGNSGAVTVGDYLQVLALDTHSAFPSEVGDWVADAIDETVELVIPFQHEGFAQLGHRDDNDLTDNVRRGWFDTLYSADNVYFWQHGHVHTEGRTVPFKKVDDEPSHDEYFELDDGYVVEGETHDGITGFGEGWRDDRSLRDEWYVERVQQNKNFSLVTLSNPSVQLQVINDNGAQIDSETFVGEARKVVATIGDVTLGDVTFGGQ